MAKTAVTIHEKDGQGIQVRCNACLGSKQALLFHFVQSLSVFSNFLKFSQIFSLFFSQKFSKMILSAEISTFEKILKFSNFLKFSQNTSYPDFPPIFLNFSQIFSNFLKFSQIFFLKSSQKWSFLQKEAHLRKFSNSQILKFSRIFSSFLKFSQNSSYYLKILHSFVFFSSDVEWLRQVSNFLNSSRLSLYTCWAGIMWLWCLSPG